MDGNKEEEQRIIAAGYGPMQLSTLLRFGIDNTSLL